MSSQVNSQPASAFKQGSSGPSSTLPTPKAAPEIAPPPNPYFGTRQIRKGVPVHIKDDFNPFKYAKVSEASAVQATWPFTGKRYMFTFPPIQHPPPQPPGHMPAVGQPPSYEEDSAAQQAAQAQVQAQQRMAAGYPVMYYHPYQYPGAQPPQPHMMAAPSNVPPGPYMASPYMQPMPYPPGMPPNGAAMYGPPQMNSMPPAGYMPPPAPPAGYQPNGGPRGSMPPTPIPQHAYAAYHHQSPQMGHQHALPYQMMMPPPGQAGPPHGYEAQQQQAGPGPMGVGH